MRWIFGLGGIVITLFVVVLILSSSGGDYVATTLTKGREAEADARQLAGVDENGMRTADSIVLDPVPGNGPTRGLLVSAIVPGGPMATHFGLMANDTIVEVGQQRVRDLNDAELAEALTLEAYQRQWPLVIDRGGVRYRLPGLVPVDAPVNALGTPVTTALPAPAPVPTATDPGAIPAPAPTRQNSIYDQVRKIPGVQGGAE